MIQRAVLALILATLIGGCTGFGPAVIRYQQADYANALADAAKRQALLNIVKLRYADAPTFLGVNQLVAGYSLQGNVSLGTDLLEGGLRLPDDAQVGVGGVFSNNPTVTYTPVAGADYARMFLAPLAPADLFGLLLAGVTPDLVIGLGLHSIGPFENEHAGSGDIIPAAPGFGEVLRLFVDLSRRGAVAIRLDLVDGRRVARLRFAERPGEERDPAERRLRELLQLELTRDAFDLVYSLGAVGPGQIGIRTRSLVEVLGQLAADIEAPAADVEAGRTYASVASLHGPAVPQIEIQNGLFEARRAFVTVPYAERWFWIDDRDFASKRVFTFVMMLFSLAQSVRPGQPPVITIPAG